MSTRDKLLASIAETIADYRTDVIVPSPEHVDRWVRQFGRDVQVAMLTEMDHILENAYLSRSVVSNFFAHQVDHWKVAGSDPASFWKQSNFLQIQAHGNSQKEILAHFGEALMERLGVSIDECGSDGGEYFYLDDVLFSGTRISDDLKLWIAQKAPTKAKVHILVIGLHSLGEYFCRRNLEKVAAGAKKEITFEFWSSVEFENTKYKKNYSDVLWPIEVPDDPRVKAYMALENRFPFDPRNVTDPPYKSRFFSSEEGRQLVEREMLIAGVKIRDKCQNPKMVMRPLGYGYFGLGFGSTIVTYRNCPNNCPLALWWGDPEATSGPFQWYPLLPRKTYAQSLDLSAIKIDF